MKYICQNPDCNNPASRRYGSKECAKIVTNARKREKWANDPTMKEKLNAWNANNKDKRYGYTKKYLSTPEGKEKHYKLVSNYQVRRRNTFEQFKLIQNFKRRIRGITDKSKERYVEELGCSIFDFIHHIESQFTEGMSWENKGTYWGYGYKVSLTNFTFPDEEATHYSNIYQKLL